MCVCVSTTKTAKCSHLSAVNPHFKSYIGPHLQGGRVNLIQLVEVAVDNGVFREAILRAGGHHNRPGNFFSRCCLVVNLNRKVKEHMSY